MFFLKISSNRTKINPDIYISLVFGVKDATGIPFEEGSQGQSVLTKNPCTIWVPEGFAGFW